MFSKFAHFYRKRFYLRLENLAVITMLMRFEAVLVICFMVMGSIALAGIHGLSTTEVGVTHVVSMGYLDTEPNDPFFVQQWSLHNTGQTGGTADADIDALEAWDVEVGSSDVVVAIVDSGIDFNHPDLVDNIWTNSGEVPDNGNDDDGNGYIDDVHGYDFHNEHNDSNNANYR